MAAVATTTVRSPPHLLSESEMTRIPPVPASETRRAGGSGSGRTEAEAPDPGTDAPVRIQDTRRRGRVGTDAAIRLDHDRRHGRNGSSAGQNRAPAKAREDEGHKDQARYALSAALAEAWHGLGAGAPGPQTQTVHIGLGPCRQSQWRAVFPVWSGGDPPDAVQVVAEEAAERGAEEEAPSDRKVREQAAAGCRRRKEDVQLRRVRAARRRAPGPHSPRLGRPEQCRQTAARLLPPEGATRLLGRPQWALPAPRPTGRPALDQGRTEGTWADGSEYNSDGATRECVLTSKNTYAAEHGGRALRMICRSWTRAESRPSGLRTPGAMNEACTAVSAARNGRGPGYLFGVVVHKGRHRNRVRGTRVVADDAGHACLKC